MIEPEAYIVGHQHYDKVEGFSYTFSWQGEEEVARVSFMFIHRHQGRIDEVNGLITIGGLELRIIDFSPWDDSYLVTRTKGLRAWYVAAKYRLTRWLDLIYRRLIMTAHIWRLADCEQGAIPTWRDLRIVKRFRKENT